MTGIKICSKRKGTSTNNDCLRHLNHESPYGVNIKEDAMRLENLSKGLGKTLLFMLSSSVAAVCFGADHNERLAAFYELKLPQGAGPHPAVVAIPGCSGFRGPMYAKTLRELREAGFATIRVDYLAASGKSRCRIGNDILVTKDKVAADIGQTVAYLQSQASIKKSAINLLGWSYGGGSVLQYLATLDASKSKPVAAVVAYYPNCRDVTMWTIPTPVLMLFGGADTTAPPSVCRQLLSGDAATMVESEEYAGAYHAFDMSNLPPKMEYAFGTIGYQPEAAKRAKARMLGFLKH